MLVEIVLHAPFDVVEIDSDVVVPVRPSLLVEET